MSRFGLVVSHVLDSWHLLPGYGLPHFVDLLRQNLLRQLKLLPEKDRSTAFFERVMDLRRFKGCDPQSSGPICFRTDGVTLSVTWGSSGKSGIDYLYAKGVNIPEPDAPVDVGDRSVVGLFRLGQSRNDLMAMPTNAGEIDLVAIDPGKCKPLQIGMVPLCSSNNWIPGNRNDVSHWHLTKADYLDRTGRTHSNQMESMRRSKNTSYASSLEDLRSHRKRTCQMQTLVGYIRTALKHLPVMAAELTHIGRRLRRWVANRRRLSAFSKWMDRLFDRETVRSRKQKLILQQVNPEVDTVDTRAERLRRRKILRSGQRRIRVPFFGDGSFSSCAKGSCPVSKKTMLKLMAARGPGAHIDEYKTSKMCPCGTSTLRDDESCNHSRFRCHETLSTASECPLGRPNGERFDRDEMATWCMLHIAQNALQGMAWPAA